MVQRAWDEHLVTAWMITDEVTTCVVEIRNAVLHHFTVARGPAMAPGSGSADAPSWAWSPAKSTSPQPAPTPPTPSTAIRPPWRTSSASPRSTPSSTSSCRHPHQPRRHLSTYRPNPPSRYPLRPQALRMAKSTASDEAMHNQARYGSSITPAQVALPHAAITRGTVQAVAMMSDADAIHSACIE